MGHYDLHGNSYSTRQEALNAETAQCAEIDSYHIRKEMHQHEQQMQRSEQHLYELIQHLEQRIEQLEKITESLRPA